MGAEKVTKKYRKGTSKPVASLLPKLLKKPARVKGFAGGHLLGAWKQICPEYYKYSYPLSLRQGVLTLAVNSDSAKQQLQYWAPTLQDRINTFYGYDVMHRLTMVTKSFKPKEEPEEIIKKISQKSISHAQKTCAKVTDEGLRKSLEKLGSQIYEKKAKKDKE